MCSQWNLSAADFLFSSRLLLHFLQPLAGILLPGHFNSFLSLLSQTLFISPSLPLRNLPITGSLCCLHNGAFCCLTKYTHRQEGRKCTVGAHCMSLVTHSTTSAHLMILFVQLLWTPQMLVFQASYPFSIQHTHSVGFSLWLISGG